MIPTSTAQFGAETAPAGSLQRQRHIFTDRLAADGFDGYPAMPARRHLYVYLPLSTSDNHRATPQET